MRDSFGARLRRHREEKQVSLADIAEQTKIKASLLQGLERDDISQWPAGIFRRAYVRAYAAAVGYDPDTAVREFLADHPEPAESAAPGPPAPTRLRGFFGSFRRKAAAAPAAVPATAPADIATATVGKRPAEPAPAIVRSSPPSDPAASRERRTPGFGPSALAASPSEPARALAASAETPPDGFRTSDLLVAARICTELGRVEDIEQVRPLLRDAAKLLEVRGLIVWIWDAAAELLKPVLVHGYTAKVQSRLRGISSRADNVTAASFRAGAPLARSGALAVPLLVPSSCAGVLALEVPDGREQDAELCALATFFAAMLAQLVGPSPAEPRQQAEAAPRRMEAQPG